MLVVFDARSKYIYIHIHYVNFLLKFFAGLLHDFHILYTDIQIFSVGSHDVLKILVY